MGISAAHLWQRMFYVISSEACPVGSVLHPLGISPSPSQKCPTLSNLPASPSSAPLGMSLTHGPGSCCQVRASLYLASQHFGIVQGRPHLTLLVIELTGVPVCSFVYSADSRNRRWHAHTGRELGMIDMASALSHSVVGAVTVALQPQQRTETEPWRRRGRDAPAMEVPAGQATEKPASNKWCFCSGLKDTQAREEDCEVRCVAVKAAAR